MKHCLLVILIFLGSQATAQTLDQRFPQWQGPVKPTLSGGYEKVKTKKEDRLPFNGERPLSSKFPRPFVEIGLSLNPCGTRSPSANAGVGLDYESPHLITKAMASFDTAKKHNELDGPDYHKGHVVGFGSNTLYKFGNRWFVGAGISWGKTITPDYTKQATYPNVVFGKDLDSVRLQFSYFREENEITHYPTLTRFTPGPGQAQLSYTCHCGSGVNGVEAQLWYPNPTLKRHIFLHLVLEPFVFHTTITDPYNLELTRAQRSVHGFTGEASYAVMYRF